MRGNRVTLQSLMFGSEQIDFSVQYRERQSLSISVHPDLSVEVYAPHDATLKKIHEKVKKRAPWIIKQRSMFERFLPRLPERRFVSGESFYYLGRQYRLRVVKGTQAKATLARGVFTIQVLKDSPATAPRRTAERWLRERAEIYFEKRLAILRDKLKRHTEVQPTLELKSMPKRWGSCTKAGKIILNPQLIKAPSHCIDYVIVHELCHLVFHNHSPQYWKLLRKMMPDWRERKERLELIEV
jgi:predicted metal-dependent hydrolase